MIFFRCLLLLTVALATQLAIGQVFGPSAPPYLMMAPGTIQYGRNLDLSDTTDASRARWGLPMGLVATHGASNGFVGMAINDQAPAAQNFPTGVTGYAKIAAGSSGNQAFGLFGNCDQYATGVCTNEVNTFNYFGAPSGNLPPSRAFGTSQTLPITLTFASYGNFPSAIAAEFGKGGQGYLTGIYMDPDAVTGYGIVLDASPTAAPTNSLVVNNNASGINLTLGTKSPMSPHNAVMNVIDSGSTSHFSIRQNGDVYGGNHLIGNGVKPTIASGFGTGATLAGSDVAGRVTVGTNGASSGVLTFASAYNAAPSCTAQNETSPNLQRTTATASNVTITGTMAAGDKVTYLCVAFQ
jgi:hypothetical protein